MADTKTTVYGKTRRTCDCERQQPECQVARPALVSLQAEYERLLSKAWRQLMDDCRMAEDGSVYLVPVDPASILS